jgi:hypothetical protein
MTQNGSAAFHGGELEVAGKNILLCVTRQMPPWKAALPEDDVDTEPKLTPMPQARLESLP